jgi:hypothetical protein
MEVMMDTRIENMDIKTLLKENSVLLFIVFAIFLFMIIFGCAWAASNVEQYHRPHASKERREKLRIFGH